MTADTVGGGLRAVTETGEGDAMWFQNLGGRDRLVRLAVSVAFTLLAIMGLGRPQGPVVWEVVSLGFALTALFGFSPLYRLAHRKTTPRHIGQPAHWDRY